MVDSTEYNQLGQLARIDLDSGTWTTFKYWGVDGFENPSTGRYYGRPWTVKTQEGVTVHQENYWTWDAAGNVAEFTDIGESLFLTYSYDSLNRLTVANGTYSRSYSYDEIGNIVSFNGASYTYGTKPHAVTQAGDARYVYDANGNMISRNTQTISWDAENRPVAIADLDETSTFVFDGDGNRVIKTENGETVIYVNRYYEKNLTTSTATTYYYLGGKLVALRKGSDLRYVHQDHLGSTSLVTDDQGDQVGDTKVYYPYGSTRSGGSLPTDKEFTGQRHDGTGLYFYNARYYDPTLGNVVGLKS